MTKKHLSPLELVKALRKKGLTQQQIADRSGVPQSAISKIERGTVRDVLSARYFALQALHAEVYGATRK